MEGGTSKIENGCIHTSVHFEKCKLLGSRWPVLNLLWIRLSLRFFYWLPVWKFENRNINLENKQKNGYIRYNIGPNKPIMKLLNSRIRSKNPIFARLFLTEKLRNKQTRLVKLGNYLMEKLSSWGWSPWSSIEPLPLKWTNLGNSIWPSWKFDLTKKL